MRRTIAAFEVRTVKPFAIMFMLLVCEWSRCPRLPPQHPTSVDVGEETGLDILL